MEYNDRQFLIIFFMCMIVGWGLIVATGFISNMVEQDKAYCLEQTFYAYDDCIVKLQG